MENSKIKLALNKNTIIQLDNIDYGGATFGGGIAAKPLTIFKGRCERTKKPPIPPADEETSGTCKSHTGTICSSCSGEACGNTTVKDAGGGLINGVFGWDDHYVENYTFG
jgi:hypothetical protein